MARLFSLTLILLLSLFLLSTPVGAADVEVVCDSTGCSGFSEKIFNDINLVPGDSVAKTISFKNLTGESINIKLISSKDSVTDDIFAQNMTFIIYKNGSIIYSNFISELFNAGSVELGTITNNQTENYEFEANFSQGLRN